MNNYSDNDLSFENMVEIINKKDKENYFRVLYEMYIGWVDNNEKCDCWKECSFYDAIDSWFSAAESDVSAKGEKVFWEWVRGKIKNVKYENAIYHNEDSNIFGIKANAE